MEITWSRTLSIWWAIMWRAAGVYAFLSGGVFLAGLAYMAFLAAGLHWHQEFATPFIADVILTGLVISMPVAGILGVYLALKSPSSLVHLEPRRANSDGTPSATDLERATSLTTRHV